jgi:MarR family transcriptional regulator, transcriptional regulator for hemolysin
MFLLHDVGRLLRLLADRRAASMGMTRAQWVILFWLDRQPGLSQKELAEILEVEPITIARLIDRLEARGLVERRADSRDRRVWRLHLCEAAAPVLATLGDERAELFHLATAGVDPATLEVVAQALRIMKSNVLCHLRPPAPAEPASEASLPPPTQKVLA